MSFKSPNCYVCSCHYFPSPELTVSSSYQSMLYKAIANINNSSLSALSKGNCYTYNSNDQINVCLMCGCF